MKTNNEIYKTKDLVVASYLAYRRIKMTCVMADLAHKTVVGEGKGNNDIKGFNDYGDFGLRQEWLTSFFNNGFNWVVDNELGTKQKISIKKWFRDAELVDSKVKMTTCFLCYCKKIL